MKPHHTDIAWSSSDSITVFGRSLPDELPGHLSFGDMAFLELEFAAGNAIHLACVSYERTLP